MGNSQGEEIKEILQHIYADSAYNILIELFYWCCYYCCHFTNEKPERFLS